ncbi:hypothetical protein [Microbacterium sp. MYb64]|uniref:hypothetical protein n=1 Tax=Microbacterium sp. MYb64 TaxID=1848691 RepID=UPI000CFD2538|nr:hypothetical protein [Microbacterium sp. MYb64]PRB07513.1 hypothetical protein CQ044_05355 [Microbacterium sp. MYb64]
MSRLRITIAEGVSRDSFDYALATLPESYVIADSAADVVVVDGGADWVQACARAVDTGARAVIVTDPVVVDAESILALDHRADEAGALVRVVDQYAGNPALAAHGRQLRAHLVVATAVILTETRAELSPADAALSVVRTLRALGFDTELAHWTVRPHSVHVAGSAGAVAVEAVVSRSSHAGQRVQVLGSSRTIDIALPAAGTSTPARLTVTTLDGEDKLASVYEAADRAEWRRTHDLLGSGNTGASQLRELAADVAAVERMIAQGSR